MIELRGVGHHYGIRPILEDVNLTVGLGELVAVVGPNGTGKSTLLSIMGGALSPRYGEVFINGLKRRGSVDEELEIRRNAVFLPDQCWLPAAKTGRLFLRAVGELYDVPDSRLMAHVPSLLELFELSEQADMPISSYSAGQKKKLSLCSALVAETSILILDEPFSGGLDPAGILALKRVLHRHSRAKDKTIVLSSPVPEIVEEIATRVLILHESRVLAFDTIENLRRFSGCNGSLSQVLERLIFPETSRKIDAYFEDFS